MSDLEQQINEIKGSTILSSFDDKITLLQWLKKLEQAIKESNIKFLDYVKINEFDNKIQIEMSFDGLKVYSNAVDVLTETDDAITEDSTLPVQSGAVYDAIAEITPILPLDATPTEDSEKGVTSGGVYDAINVVDSKITPITPLDATPTENSTKGVTSGGVFNAIASAGVNRKYMHQITARIKDGSTSLGSVNYIVINTRNTSFSAGTSVYETISHNFTDYSFSASGLYNDGNLGIIVKSIYVSGTIVSPSLTLDGIVRVSPDNAYFATTILQFTGSGEITYPASGITAFEVVTDNVIQL